ncbi:MAG: molybdenum cofactor guanylyltransferase [Actinobacteria bacterium]|nr:molybdenum cofactor guanylyltransferase [Actinomycetota bacterium]
MKRVFALLAGGKASRLGGIEKLNLDFNGRTLIDHIIEKYLKTEFFDRFVVLSGSKKPEEFRTGYDLEFISDVVDDGGPLLALYSLLLNSSPEDHIFLHGGDMPFTEPEPMFYLYDRFKEGFDVVIPESNKGSEPLFAWYSAKTIDAVEKVVSMGKRRVVSFFPLISVREVRYDEITNLCNPDLFFFNINTEEDYRKALILLERFCEKND